MKQVAGSLRLDLAQYREMEAFSQFGSDLDDATKQVLARGARVVELLKQPRYAPMPVEQQVLSIFAVNKGFTDKIEPELVRDFRDGLIQFVSSAHPELLSAIKTEKQISDDTEAGLMKAIAAYADSFGDA
jgi:F-type H+-transporting ATPase subunit alpha